jgi:hypothetical protein
MEINVLETPPDSFDERRNSAQDKRGGAQFSRSKAGQLTLIGHSCDPGPAEVVTLSPDASTA